MQGKIKVVVKFREKPTAESYLDFHATYGVMQKWASVNLGRNDAIINVQKILDNKYKPKNEMISFITIVLV